MPNAASEPSSRPVPAMALLCLKTAYMASHRAIFKRPMRGRPDNFHEWPFRKWHGFHELAISKNGTGSRARTYDLRFWRPPLYQLSYARIARCYFIKRTRTQVEFLGVAATSFDRRNPRASAQAHMRSSRAKVQCSMKLMTQLRYMAGTVTSSSACRSNGISHIIGEATLSRIICIIAAAKKEPTGARYR